MDNSKWATKAQTYQQAQPPVYDTGYNSAHNSGYVPTEAMRAKPIYNTFDCWQAAYLDLLQIPYLYCQFMNGRQRWFFDNANDAAWMAGKDFRQGDDVNLPISRFRQSFRFMQEQARLAREKGVSHGTDITDSAA